MRLARSFATAALLALLLPACAGLGYYRFERPDVILVNAVPLESTLFEQRVRLDLRVLNPNSRALDVEGIDLELEVNGIPLARALGNDTVTIPARGEAVTSVVASTTLIDLLRQALAYSEREESVYHLFGRVHLGGTWGRALRFEHTGSLAGLERLLRDLEGMQRRGGERL